MDGGNIINSINQETDNKIDRMEEDINNSINRETDSKTDIKSVGIYKSSTTESMGRLTCYISFLVISDIKYYIYNEKVGWHFLFCIHRPCNLILFFSKLI